MNLKIATTIFFALIGSELYAQLTVHRGTMSINTISVVSVKGNVTLLGTVHHQGTLLIHHNLFGGSTFLSSEGSLHLVGSDQQVWLESASLSSLSIRGGGTKQLSNKLTILKELSLVDGILQPDESSQLMLGSSAQLNGGSSTSYVDGFLYHTGTGEKFYPVGKNGTYAPATLLKVTGSNPTVGMAYFPSAPFNGAEFHWQQSVIDGTYDGSPVELTFTNKNADYEAYSHELLVLAAEDHSGRYTALGQSSLGIRGNRFTIASDHATAQPILTVGFDIPEDTKHLYLPNAFSPTAPDAEDRRIKVYGQKISSRNFYFAIQDTWGTLVYETASWEEASAQGWSGSVSTANIAATYRYRLEGEFIGGKRFRQTGTIVQY